ncbi:MAG TPA: TlpA disulfide reductase family protein [Flavobacterium sp.]|jgi:thiol-disulfide isomerase/thioredoxin
MKRLFLTILLSASYFPTLHAQDDAILEKEVFKRNVPIQTEIDSIKKIIQNFNEKFSIATDHAVKEQLTHQVDSMYNIMDPLLVKMLKADLEFAKQHPASTYCMKLVSSRIRKFEAMQLYDEYESVYNNLSPLIKDAGDGEKLKEQLVHFKHSKTGSVAPLFVVTDLNRQSLTLEQFRGKKFVLIDFWASWCGPCVADFPNLKELYKSYGADLEIISITTDDDQEKWKKAIIKYGMGNWKHFSLKNNPETTVYADYFVGGIPHKILINKDGIIIGKWKGYSENNSRELKATVSAAMKN